MGRQAACGVARPRAPAATGPAPTSGPALARCQDELLGIEDGGGGGGTQASADAFDVNCLWAESGVGGVRMAGWGWGGRGRCRGWTGGGAVAGRGTPLARLADASLHAPYPSSGRLHAGAEGPDI